MTLIGDRKIPELLQKLQCEPVSPLLTFNQRLEPYRAFFPRRRQDSAREYNALLQTRENVLSVTAHRSLEQIKQTCWGKIKSTFYNEKEKPSLQAKYMDTDAAQSTPAAFGESDSGLKTP